MLHSTTTELPKVVLVGLQLPRVTNTDFEASLAELKRLVNTLGYEVIGQIRQKRSSEKSAQVLGDGKLKELATWTGGTGTVQGYVNLVKSKAKIKRELEEAEETEADLAESEILTEANDESDESNTTKEKAGMIVVDHDLSPSQLRNLESACGVPVLDRTGVIIEIFSRHARTKQARLQVEVARLAYIAPRMRESQMGGDRQGGGIGAKGSGETKLELDKRKIRDRIKELKDEIDSLGDQDEVRRARRASENTVALVGYTNAGKSSLMRALTGSEVLVQDKLFATLDTTVRPMYPETTPKILISDTVGFIKKLPHDLVASFKSTLDEASHASLQLIVVDSSDPSFTSQLKVTEDVLSEIKADESPRQLVLNKVDRLTTEQIENFKVQYPNAWFLSAVNPESVKDLKRKIQNFFEKDMQERSLFIEYKNQKQIYEIRKRFRIISEVSNDQGTEVKFLGTDQDYQIFINTLKKR